MIDVSHLVVLAAATKSKSTSPLPILIILVVAVGGYMFFLRPQQQKAKAARAQGSAVQVGDEVQTIGGIIGTVVSMDNDRVTIVSGGATPGASSTELVLVRAAIARKVPPPVQPDGDDLGIHYGMEDGDAEHADHDESTHDEHDEPTSEVDDQKPEEDRGR
jgi:preprotein translocase subunit YajC